MIRKLVSGTVITLFLFLFDKTTSFECLTDVYSDCPNNKITKWNQRNIGENLKNWLKSVNVVRLNETEAELWHERDIDDRGKHCKTLVVKRFEYFHQHLPEIFSPNITILGKLEHAQARWYPARVKFHGPVWADINDQMEWYIDDKAAPDAISGLSEGALLHNGMYYGTLNNEKMAIGKQGTAIKMTAYNGRQL